MIKGVPQGIFNRLKKVYDDLREKLPYYYTNEKRSRPMISIRVIGKKAIWYIRLYPDRSLLCTITYDGQERRFLLDFNCKEIAADEYRLLLIVSK